MIELTEKLNKCEKHDVDINELMEKVKTLALLIKKEKELDTKMEYLEKREI